MTIAGE